MSRKIENAESRAIFFGHSVVWSLPAVLLRKLPNESFVSFVSKPLITVIPAIKATTVILYPQMRHSHNSLFGSSILASCLDEFWKPIRNMSRNSEKIVIK